MRKDDKYIYYGKMLVGFSILVSMMLMLYLVYEFSQINNVKKRELVREKKRVERYTGMQFKGVVLEKKIDSANHLRKIINVKDIDRGLVRFDISFEKEEVFHFIKDGDSISKNNGELNFRLVRHNLDTVIKMARYDTIMN